MIRDVNTKSTSLISWLRQKLDWGKSQPETPEQIQKMLRLKEQGRQLEKQLQIQLLNTVAQLNESDAIAALGTALNLKNPDTGAHSKRVTTFAVVIAREMDLSEEQIGVIAHGAFLHDIGKLAVPDLILKKPGTLDANEIAVMQEHCYRGYWTIKNGIPSLTGTVAEIVYAHHEKFDGTGYPRGLRGNDIPLEARLVAVANTLDAMTSDHPYRLAGSFGDAVDEVQRCAGSQFDPELVEHFLKIPASVWSDMRMGVEDDH